jgi:hypothetical protein
MGFKQHSHDQQTWRQHKVFILYKSQESLILYYVSKIEKKNTKSEYLAIIKPKLGIFG